MKAPDLKVICIVVIISEQKFFAAVGVEIYFSCNAQTCEHTALYSVFAVHKFIVCNAVFFRIFAAYLICCGTEFCLFAVLFMCGGCYGDRGDNHGDDYCE